MDKYAGFHKWGYPKMDDLGPPHFRKPPPAHVGHFMTITFTEDGMVVYMDMQTL